MSTDSADSDVTPAQRPIIVATRNDVIDGHLSCDITAGDCVQSLLDSKPVTVKTEQIDNNDEVKQITASSTVLTECRHISPPTPRNTNDDDDTQPLDLTKRRVCDTNTSSCGADGGLTTSHVGTQILLLNGRRYEILPVGAGRWVSRSEYELQRPTDFHSSDTATDVIKRLDDVNGNTCDVTECVS